MSFAVLHRVGAYRVLGSGFGFGVAIREWIPALFAFDPFHALFYRFHDRTYPLCLVGEFYILGFKCLDGFASVGAFSLLTVNE